MSEYSSNTGGVQRWESKPSNPESATKEENYNPEAHRGGVVRFDGHTGTSRLAGRPRFRWLTGPARTLLTAP